MREDITMEKQLQYLLGIYKRRIGMGMQITLREVIEEKINERSKELSEIQASINSMGLGPEHESSSVGRVIAEIPKLEKEIAILRHILKNGPIEKPEIAERARSNVVTRIERKMIEIIQEQNVDIIVVYRYLKGYANSS